MKRPNLLPQPVIRYACLALCIKTANAAIITLSPGIAFENNGQTQTLLLETSPQNLSNQYVSNNNWHSTLSTQLFLGTDFFKSNQVSLRSGLTIGFSDDIEVKGIINQFALPDFDNLNFRYNVQSFSAMATLGLCFLPNQQWQPYLNGSIGFSNNHTYNYQESPRNLSAVPMNPYGARSINSFAYSFGAGIMHQFSSLFSVGIGYQFANLGQAELGISPAQQTTQTPSLKHVMLQQILLNLSWKI
ncbi:MAG: hypothetical protein P1U40_00675 [Coxiellaceae bacterium]|nr:hypothetical protein [Coxiellaceae bacterium]